MIAGIVAAVVATNTGHLLFNVAWPLLLLAPFLGLLVAGRTKRHESTIEGNQVLRHDGGARLSHWTHALGTAALIVTGVLLGLWFTKALVGAGQQTWLMMNLHCVAAGFFLFGTFYYVGNTVVSSWRLKGHLPTKDFLSYTIQHYGHMMGFKSSKMPPEKKYFESEKLAFVVAVLSAALLVVTGIVKVLAHVLHGMPGGLMRAAFIVHDASAILITLFLLAHLFFGVIIPSAWPGLHSMLSGYMSLDVVKKHHPGWYEELKEADHE